MRHKGKALAAAMAAGVLILAGCSGSDSDNEAAATNEIANPSHDLPPWVRH